jgi:hypothetical protein
MFLDHFGNDTELVSDLELRAKSGLPEKNMRANIGGRRN